MKKLVICLGVFILFGCSQSNEDLNVATKFWDSQKNTNLTELEQVLAAPEEIETFRHMKFVGDSFSASKNDNGEVLVNIKRFCYPDLIVHTEVVDVKGVKKVDSKATIKNLFKAARENQYPTQKYCYAFDDTKLSGKINGQTWAVEKIDVRTIELGNNKRTIIALHPEDCDTEFTGGCTLPKLIISNLNLDSDGGNFSASENITIHTPPSNNKIISKGSYRISPITSDETKLEISFKHDEQNYLSGFVVLTNQT